MCQGVAEYGVVESVDMQDFTCHHHLVFKLGPQVNFIISGKSAALLALTIVLGGKSNATGQGNGLKNFICEEQQYIYLLRSLNI
ncbi:hypothetical protein FA15DRAFT_587572 [Coprinopsis marcescibilis]|uniref:Uncharacterized protein n=1 Tax=Coprinopsis marcescibilis TaxID=230819 RepID=A0A5C3L2D0_COPMA|nr:hypothetical protein FA15DRAFT_587572 [Coprinopsis marcescibilis]